MGKMLIIAEKPSVAAAIANALGGYTKHNGWHESPTGVISNGIGHLVKIDAPASSSTGRGLDSLPVIPDKFDLTVIDKTKDQFNTLRKLIARDDVTRIVNACDAGREGELIFRLIYEKSGCKKPIMRMWFQTMTKEGIQDAFNNLRPGRDFDNLYDEAKCRSESDWIIGINSSRAITSLYELQNQRYESMTAGRVQTPTETILVDRELEITHFVPKDYWEIHGTFAARAGTYTGKWIATAESALSGEDAPEGGKLFDRVSADAIVKKCLGVQPSSVVDKSTKKTTNAPRLFDITTLQRTANKKFKFSAKKTLDIAQALYEKHQATTYPRTDSSALPEDYVETAREIMACLSGSFKVHAQRVIDNSWIAASDKRVFNNAEISDHFAIIPTLVTPSGLDEDEAKIYDLIVRRFIAVFHPAAEYLNTQRTTLVAGETFYSSGRSLIRSGWLEVYGTDPDGDKTPSLCVVDAGESVRNVNIETKAKQTTPPPRYTEDTLLGAMEGAGKLIDDNDLRDAMKDKGLGTGATRAAIIENLLSTKDGQGRNKEPYAHRVGKEQHLVPTQKGIDLVAFLRANGFPELTSPKMTGEWEHKLRLVSQGKYARNQFMSEIGDMAKRMVDMFRNRAKSVPKADERLLSVPCPKCSHNIRSTQRTVECQDGCGFKLWREVCGRDLTDREFEVLINTGCIEKLDGFISKSKRHFSAGLKLLPDWKTELVFEDRPTSTTADTVVDAQCPVCSGRIVFRDGKFPVYACENDDFKIYKVIAGRPLSDGEAIRLINHKSLPVLKGFVSQKTRKKFDAGIKLSNDFSKVEFVFA